MDRSFFVIVAIFLAGCAPEYQYLQTWEEGGSEIGEVCLVDDLVCVEFDFTDKYIVFENFSGEWYFVQIVDYYYDVVIETTDLWDGSWWIEGIHIDSAEFEHGMYVEIAVYDVIDWERLKLGDRSDVVVLIL